MIKLGIGLIIGLVVGFVIGAIAGNKNRRAWIGEVWQNFKARFKTK